MDAQVLARWQFGITTVYHFFFVPITLGTGWMVAVMETLWLRTNNIQWLRMTKFFSKLFLINFAAGVVTGIVQEFQFGMNWSEYSRFVGDIFGAPLALEALVAFFLESTFIGIWIFGWDRLSGWVHNLMMYLTAVGATLSAVFILAANSFMQNPVGATYNNGRAELEDFSLLFTNPFFIAATTHTLSAAFMVSGSLLAGVAGWKLVKASREAKAVGLATSEGGAKAVGATDASSVQTAGTAAVHPDAAIWRSVAKLGAVVLIAASLATFGTGHYQGQVEAKFQPMKLAASEGVLDTTTAAGFSIVAIYTQERDSEGITRVTEVFSFEVPYVLSILAFNDPNAEVKGINDLTEEYLTDGHMAIDGSRTQLQQEFASDLAQLSVDPVPNVMATYYSFRLMIGLGSLAMLIGLALLWFTRKDKVPPDHVVTKLTLGALPFLPLLATSFGWILTEVGRQPWIVYGVLPTWTANSPNVSAGEVLFSMIVYTLIYAIIAVIVLRLFFTFIGKGLPDVTAPKVSTDADAPLTFAY